MTVFADSSDLGRRLAGITVLVVGDLMLDCYYWGEVGRISPEAPVPVVKVNQKTYTLGGSGNVAANLAGLGCKVNLVGLVGEDESADRLHRLLADQDVADRGIRIAGRATITKTRIMAGKQQVVRLDEEDGRPIDEAIADRVKAAVDERLREARAVVLSDYGKGMFHDKAFVQTLIRACKEASIPVFIDPKGADWQRYEGATCVTPNTAELALVAGKRVDGEDVLVAVAEALRERLSLDRLLVTRGPRGMALFGDGSDPLMIAARSREVFDVSGAGDTVIATMAACVAAGLSFGQAAGVANVAAGIVVGKVGTQPVHWEELERDLAESRQTSASALWKVADPREATARISRWRQAEQRIVFTNGCFDLLHPGHVSLLHQARQFGDRLIVGLNSDTSIRRLKGDDRPILPGQDRAAILSALEDVDMVVFFEEDTPLNLIEQLRPDILVKGADYRIEEVVGREIVEAYGGKVSLVNILPGHSTSAIAQKISDQADRKGKNDGN